MSHPEQPLTDISQLQIPGTEGLWRKAVLLTEEMLDRLLAVTDPNEADEQIPAGDLGQPAPARARTRSA